MKTINFSSIEKKWQKRWESAGIFRAKERKDKKKFYMLTMYPYPSGTGLHIGHVFNYSLVDIYARYKRACGFEVLHPMGYDSFGLPAENAAIKAKSHPKKFTEEAIKNFMKQQKALGLSYDWNRIIESHKPEYYRWDQWIFLEMFTRGLAYRKKAPVNYCIKCKTVLANEQVVNGKCWRHEDTDVEVKQLEQWFLKITDYAGELYEKLNELNGWPETIRAMQKNWIGKSEGVEIDFAVFDKEKVLKVFTTRADTLFGVTFLTISTQHSELSDFVSADRKKDVEKFLKKIKSTKEEEMDKMDKEGVFSGSYAIHPLTDEKIPIWIGNFVVADYGSGVVMGVPMHDQRDFEFAQKYKLEMKQVVMPDIEITSGKDAIRADKETIERNSVFGIVKHWKENKYFLLDWQRFNWKSFIIGGVEDGETPEEAVAREVKEETGYQDIKKIIPVNFDTQVKFFAEHKGINRKGRFTAFLIELGSGKYVKPEEEHTKNHVGVWVDYKNVRNYLNLENNIRIWNYFVRGGHAYENYGVLINSGAFDGLKSSEAKEHIVNALESKGLGRKKIAYRLRDWLISRQRFWGAPIPIVYCDSCGIVPVKEKDLPVKLPENIRFSSVENPLKNNSKFVNTKCPSCGGKARRETDTMDTFIDSSWYFLRYTDSRNNKKIFDSEKAGYWMPIDLYVGGKEHATLHLIYFRFMTKFFRDLGLLKIDEPALKFFSQGLIYGGDGFKMSKSRGNVVNPDDVMKKYGADALRLALVSSASADKDSRWDEKIVEGSLRFILRFMNYCSKYKGGKTSVRVAHKLNKTIKEVSGYIEELKYNLAVISLREFFGVIEAEDIEKEDLKKFVKMMSVFTPHVCEETWKKLGGKGFVSASSWPKVNEGKIDEKLEEAERQLERTITDVKQIKEITNNDKPKVYLYTIPSETKTYSEKADLIAQISGAVSVKVYAVNDAKKYDPEGKSKKAKPGKPGIYVE